MGFTRIRPAPGYPASPDHLEKTYYLETTKQPTEEIRSNYDRKNM
jgi:cobalamin-dependent methionine synthase I